MGARLPGFLGGVGLLGLWAALSPAGPAGKGYAPAVPVAAVQYAVRSRLRTVGDWVAGKDYLSAAEAAQGLDVLAHLLACQGSEPAWKERTAALAEACARLTAAAREKDVEGCARLLRDCARILGDLEGTAPGAPCGTEFRPRGGTKTWMLLLDEIHSDARAARSGPALETLAQALAEEANAAQYLRPDETWRRDCREVRDTALAAAREARVGGLDAARGALRKVYRGCETCHDRSRK